MKYHMKIVSMFSAHIHVEYLYSKRFHFHCTATNHFFLPRGFLPPLDSLLLIRSLSVTWGTGSMVLSTSAGCFIAWALVCFRLFVVTLGGSSSNTRGRLRRLDRRLVSVLSSPAKWSGLGLEKFKTFKNFKLNKVNITVYFPLITLEGGIIKRRLLCARSLNIGLRPSTKEFQDGHKLTFDFSSINSLWCMKLLFQNLAIGCESGYWYISRLWKKGLEETLNNIR